MHSYNTSLIASEISCPFLHNIALDTYNGQVKNYFFLPELRKSVRQMDGPLPGLWRMEHHR